VASERLGVLRLAQRFAGMDRLGRGDVRRLADHAAALLEPHLQRAQREGGGLLVGTSGTLLALGRLALDRARLPGGGLHHVTVKARALRDAGRRLALSSLAERRRLPGLDPRRAEVIAVGAVLLEVVLDRLDADELLLCEWALREGMLLDHLEPCPPAAGDAEVRRRSVAGLAHRSFCDERHARQVARLALQLFDGTRRRHRLTGRERALLESAALLHDVGRQAWGRGHHKRSGQVIRAAGLHGFDPREVEVMALVARYHRGRRPRRRHGRYRGLPPAARRTVRVLAGILRMAHALDGRGGHAARSLAAAERGRALVVRVRAEQERPEELARAARRGRLLERALGLPVRVEWQALPQPASGFGVRARQEERT
jgi:exopolyphosphatase / guanosine-5'-triphosphate,3'-diphosphate pyrophosphatase